MQTAKTLIRLETILGRSDHLDLNHAFVTGEECFIDLSCIFKA